MSPDRSRHGRRHSDEALLDGARRVLVDKGYYEATMEEIAAGAGASKPTLYSRFGEKEQLYRRALLREAEDLAEVLAATHSVFGGEAPRIRIRAAITAFFDWAGVEREGFALLFGDFESEIAWAVRNEFLSDVRGKIARGIDETVRTRWGHGVDESAEVVASMCISLVVGGAHVAATTPGGMAGSAELITAFTEQALTNLDQQRLIGAAAQDRG